MGVDSLKTWGSINHLYRGNPYGLNTLFGDGHVRFQALSQMNKPNSFAPFDQKNLWDPGVSGGPGNTSYVTTPVPAARIIMNGYQP